MRKSVVLIALFILSFVGVSQACDFVFVPITTSCGKSAVASGCTTQELIEDVMQWEDFIVVMTTRRLLPIK